MNLTYIEASCHCELNSFCISLQSNLLPILVDFCHCTTCRHSSAELALQYLPFSGIPLKSYSPATRARTTKLLHGTRSGSRSPIPSDNLQNNDQLVPNTIASLLAPPILISVEEPPPSPFELSDLKQYCPSPGRTHYFCKTCFAQIFHVTAAPDVGSDQWAVAVGVLDRTDGIVKTRSHVWVGDTLDGGFANHLPILDGIQLLRHKAAFGSRLLSSTWTDPTLSDNIASAAVLPAYCHCRTVTFTISRPNPESALLTAPFPDLLYPYNVTHLSKIRNPSDKKWWLKSSPTDESSTTTRFLAGYCACPSCRLTTGTQLQAWAFIPRSNILHPHTNLPISLVDSEPGASRLPGIVQYMSSPGKFRECCARCGAVVFWWQADRPDLVDVSVGLFDERVAGGVRAEEWLVWHKARVSFEEMAATPELVHALLHGLKSE